MTKFFPTSGEVDIICERNPERFFKTLVVDAETLRVWNQRLIEIGKEVLGREGQFVTEDLINVGQRCRFGSFDFVLAFLLTGNEKVDSDFMKTSALLQGNVKKFLQIQSNSPVSCPIHEKSEFAKTYAALFKGPHEKLARFLFNEEFLCKATSDGVGAIEKFMYPRRVNGHLVLLAYAGANLNRWDEAVGAKVNILKYY